MDDASQFEALMARRHSCRAFRPEPVPSAMIERALVMASRTASWCNAQPWHVHIVSGEPLERLQAALLKRARTGAAATPELDWPREYTAPTAIGGANAAGVFTRLSVSARVTARALPGRPWKTFASLAHRTWPWSPAQRSWVRTA
ncbi:MAG: hypothetical protein RL758_400 [Pseudomonadota bacterium]|jgi:nitroreductase